MKTVALLATGTAQAALVCARPRSDGTFSTTLKLREACKPNEVEIGIVTQQPLRLYGPTTTSSSTTTSTIPSCGSSGRAVAGVCWYVAAAEADNCTQTCAAVGRAYDEATRTFAGSDGTLANCQAVTGAFPIFGSASDTPFCSTARGCSVIFTSEGNGIQRCMAPATTAEAGGDLFRRLCACS